MKKSIALTSVLLAALLVGCGETKPTETDAETTTVTVEGSTETEESTEAEEVTDTEAVTDLADPETTLKQDTAADSDVSASHLWESAVFCVDKTDSGYALFNKADGKIIREYSEFGVMSAVETDGSVGTYVRAVGLSDEGKTTVYSLSEYSDETVLLTAENGAHILGDYIVADFKLYTAKRRTLGYTHGLYPENSAPRYDETAQFGLPDSDYSIKFYLCQSEGSRPLLPRKDDTADYIVFSEDVNRSYIGIYLDNGRLMFRYFTSDIGHITPRGVYVREETSVATIAGSVAGYDLYAAPNVTFLADKSGNIVLFEFGEISESDGFVVISPYNLQLPCTLLSRELEVIAENCLHYCVLENGDLIASTLNYHAPSYSEQISVIKTDGTVTKLADCNYVFALSDYGGLYEKDGKLWHITPSGNVTELPEWNDGLTYEGQARIGEFENAPEHYFFRDKTNQNSEGATLIYEWTLNPENGEIHLDTYYAKSLHENVFDINHPY